MTIDIKIGNEMYGLVKQLFPICRSITGDGVRETLDILNEHIPINIQEVPSGKKVFDWTIPQEWNVKDAYVMDDNGHKVVDFQKNNLHVVGYSIPIDKIMDLEELNKHLYSIPEKPDAIPYRTSYYEKRWGFCIAHKDRQKLKKCQYKVFIDSELKDDGYLSYGEFIIPGKSKEEVFVSTYICHPSMANNELSGPVLSTFLAKWVKSESRRYTYRFVFIPETIGSIVYLSQNLQKMKKNVIAGFNITCVGDNRAYSYLPTRKGDAFVDKVALNVLSFRHPDFIRYSFIDKGSDERQYNSPGVDLPVCCLMRSKFGTYPEYHTSLDDLSFITPEGLSGSYEVVKDCIELIEKNYKYKIKCLCQPHLGKRGLYSTFDKEFPLSLRKLVDFLAYADGKNDLIDISNIINVPAWDLYSIIDILKNEDLIAEL